MLSSLPGMIALQEPIPARVTDPAQRLDGYALQVEILKAKAEAGKRFALSAETMVLDRTIAEDREVFFRLHQHLGSLSPTRVAELVALSDEVERVAGLEPTALVLLRARSDVLRARMISDGRPTWLIESLEHQLTLYEDYYAQVGVPRLSVDTSMFNLGDMRRLALFVHATLTARQGSLTVGGQDIAWK